MIISKSLIFMTKRFIKSDAIAINDPYGHKNTKRNSQTEGTNSNTRSNGICGGYADSIHKLRQDTKRHQGNRWTLFFVQAIHKQNRKGKENSQEPSRAINQMTSNPPLSFFSIKRFMLLCLAYSYIIYGIGLSYDFNILGINPTVRQFYYDNWLIVKYAILFAILHISVKLVHKLG